MSRRRISAALTTRKRGSGGIKEINFTIDGQPRRAIYRPLASGTAVLVRIGIHGGEAGRMGSEHFLEDKLSPPRAGVVDYAGQALIYPDTNDTHWLYPETLTTPLPGNDLFSDFDYFSYVILDAKTRYPGVPICLVGYSSGSKVQMSWMYNVGMDTNVSAIALVKYTPLASWLTGTPEVFNAQGTVPPVFLWFANNDTTAPQTAPNVGFSRAKTAWENTKAFGITPTVTAKVAGATGPYHLSTYAGDNFRYGIEDNGSHAWESGDVIDDEIATWCSQKFGFTLP